MNTLRLSFSLALLAGFPAQALLLQQGEARFDIDPATLQVTTDNILANQAQSKQAVAGLQSTLTQASWQWPNSDIQITARLEGGDLRLSFSSSRAQTLDWFTLPPQTATLLLPIGEGSRIPLDNTAWQHYLVKEMTPLDTNWDLKLPLWSQQQQGKVYSWLLLTPFSNQVSFASAKDRLTMRSSHQFNRFNQQQAFEVLLHVGRTPLSGARRYREYLQQSGQFSSLRDKIRIAPEGEKLIGATHIYLWGDKLLAPADVKNWPGLLAWLVSPTGEVLWQKMDTDSQKTVQKLAGKIPESWQQQALIDAINQALVALTPLKATPDDADFLQAQRQQATHVREWARRQLGDYLAPADSWGQGLAKPLVEALHQAGLPRLWLGTDNWTAEFLHPQAVESAKKSGYLIASYDSYDTAIPRGVNDSWLTAQLPTTLREECAIVRADGSKKPGFGKQGYYLNPGCVLPYSQQRMRELVQLAGLNSLFLDVDGTGMVSDDY
ncbi:MAG: glycoside hydrolase, partial [Serratia proteamaculans]